MKFEKEVRPSGDGKFLKTGVFNAKVLAINPSRSELNKLLNREPKDDDKDIEYVYEKDGKQHVRIAFWVEDTLTGWKTKIEYDLVDEPAETAKSKKPIWVNQVGDNQKVDKEAIQNWFKEFYKSKDDKTVIGEKDWRRAVVNEAPLMEFLRVWLSGKSSTGQSINWYVPSTNILLDKKKLFRGNVSELTDLLKADPEENVTGNVICAAWVDSYEKDGEIKHAQKVWLYKMAPGYMWSKVNLSMQQNSWDSSSDTKKLKNEWTGEYGIPKGFVLKPLQEFNPDEHIEATNETMRKAPETVDDTEY